MPDIWQVIGAVCLAVLGVASTVFIGIRCGIRRTGDASVTIEASGPVSARICTGGLAESVADN